MMRNLDTELRDIINSVKAYLELERESGCGELFVRGADKMDMAAPPDEWASLKKEVSLCDRCGLYKTRRNTVFGSGSVRAEVMFIGEAPGEGEDIQGLPFVGRAGELLTKIIEAMGLARSGVFIANVLKCRPPGNRAPLPTEILACEDYLKRQIEFIKPKAICTLGKFATQALLRTEEPISALRGHFREYNGIKVMPTFHPAYLLRNPSDKRLVWQDMKKVKGLLNAK